MFLLPPSPGSNDNDADNNNPPRRAMEFRQWND